jgi:hypothetical protein
MLEWYRQWREASKWREALSLENYLACRTEEEKKNFLYTADRLLLMAEDVKFDGVDPLEYGISSEGLESAIRYGRKLFRWLPKPINPTKNISKEIVRIGTAVACFEDVNDGDLIEVSLDGPGKIRKFVEINRETRNKAFPDRLQMEMYAPYLGRLHGYRISFKDDGEKKELISPYEPFYASYKLRVVKRAKPKPEEAEKLIKEMERAKHIQEVGKLKPRKKLKEKTN